MKNDPRVTRVGRLLRRTSLDELPPTGTADLAWTLWLALAGLVLGSGLLLRHAARQRAS
jgi:hypothetical protein